MTRLTILITAVCMTVLFARITTKAMANLAHFQVENSGFPHE